eukprot:11606521-Alexandrium_andersonii.AAC.1
MSASLVGSEMCIRDSSRSARSSRAALPAPGQLGRSHQLRQHAEPDAARACGGSPPARPAWPAGSPGARRGARAAG